MDCICCGFGAIILLFVLTKISKESYPRRSQAALVNTHLSPKLNHPVSPQETVLHQLLETLTDLSAEKERLIDQMIERENDLVLSLSDLEKQQQILASLEKKLTDQALDKNVEERIGDQLLAARQQLTEEMKRLLLSLPKPTNRVIGGIPVIVNTCFLLLILQEACVGSGHFYGER